MRLRSRARGVAIVALASLAGTAKAGVPDWAKPVIETAPPVPEGVPDWPERTLLNETRIVVETGGGTWQIEKRQVSQVLSARGDSVKVGFFAFDDTTKVRKSKGWQLAPGESAHRNFGGGIDINVSDEFLTDAKARAVALEDVKKGSLLVYDFQAERHPYTLTSVETFFDGVPIDVQRVSVELPPGWSLKYRWLPGDGPEPTHDGTTWVFERRDLTPLHEEPLDEDPGIVAPHLVLAPQPPAGLATTTPALADWDALGRWYAELDNGRAAPTPEISAAVGKALEKAGPAPLDKIRAATLLVRDRVRYVARELGIGGYQPHVASAVLADGHGDCKDKAALLRACLTTAGFQSCPVLINATSPYTVAPDVPTPGSFDHVVVGVVWPKDAPFPDEAASSRVDAGAAGTLLVVDPTDERAWPGSLPPELAGKSAVAVVEGRGVLINLPEPDAKWHRVAIAAKATAREDRSVSVDLTTRLYGGPAEEARLAHASSFKDRRESVEDALRRAWPGAQVKDYKVNPEEADGAFLYTVAPEIPTGAPALQDDTYWPFAIAPLEISRVPLAKRKGAVQFPYPMQLRYELSFAGAPPGFSPPSELRESGSTWAVSRTYRVEGGTILGSWGADMLRTHFEPATFADLKKFWNTAGKASETGIAIAAKAAH